MTVSVIIPVYNEEKVILSCLASLAKQTIVRQMEIIVVDDGSTDSTKSKVKSQKSKVILLEQNHSGPGAGRNLGASKAKGDVLVFVDADMEFDSDFVEKLIAPIVAGRTIGSFSKEEYLLNRANDWARYWNLNLGRKASKMLPDNYPDTSPVFRAILKSKFDQIGGFDVSVGYADDWSLSRKLGVESTAAPGAKFYHRNPDSLQEVWIQARWFGKNEFLTKNIIRRLYNLFRYCPLWALRRFYDPKYFLFVVVYNCAVCTSVVLSFIGEEKNK